MTDSVGVDLSEYAKTAESIDFDVEAFEADIKDYEKVVKDNFPEAKEEGKKSGDIDGLTYEYTSKSYDLTAADAQKVAKAVLEKAKGDENFKKLYEQGVDAANQSMAKYGEESSTPSYEEAIDKMLEEVNGDINGESSAVLETYENSNGEFTGFLLKPNDEDGELKLITVSNENAEGMDMTFDSGDGDSYTAYGALKSENDTVNGGYTISVSEGGEESVKVVYTVTDMKNVGDNFAGTLRVDLNVNDGSEANSGWMEVKSNSTADDVDVSFDFGFNGENALTMTMTSKKTEASDVSLPGSDAKIYNALDEEQMNEYLSTCDTEGFMNKLKETLGDEMYNSIMGSSSSSYSSQIDDDDDFDWDKFEEESENNSNQPA